METRTPPQTLTGTQRLILGLAILPMIAVGIAGGIGTYTNISATYGSGTAVGALAAGEGATAVLAMIYLGVTLLGQPAPTVVRVGLWLLPGMAAIMGAAAAGATPGRLIVYAATPMAVTAAAEGLAFLARRIVVYQRGRDAEAEARGARILRDLAYHGARAERHPSRRARRASQRRIWRLARQGGAADPDLALRLAEVQRTRLTQGADTILRRMFTPDTPASASAPSLSASATAPSLPPATSANDSTPPRTQDTTTREDGGEPPAETASDQGGDTSDVRPALTVVRDSENAPRSIAADVRTMAAQGIRDIQYILAAVASRHGRTPDDPTLRRTVERYLRQARAASASTSVSAH